MDCVITIILAGMKKLLVVFGLFTILMSCQSVKKYNEQITKPHSIADLHSDIDNLYAQFKRHHPRLYQYTPKTVLDSKFDSLKRAINKPMDSRTFYKQLAPVVAQVKQGHVSVGSVLKRFTKKERKQLKKKTPEFYDLDFEFLEDKLWVKAYRGKDSTLVGAEVVTINNEPALDLIALYKTRFSSDGFNKTFYNNLVSRGFLAFYQRDKGFIDSLNIAFKRKDSLFSKTFKRKDKSEDKPKGEKLNDTVSKEKVKPKKLTKDDKIRNRIAKKKKRKEDKTYGFIPKTKTYTRNFNFIGKDSSVAFMKIRGFGNRGYKPFYKESFKKLDSAKTKHLILDLRDNLGGRISEIDYLYSYLTEEDYVFLDPIEVNTRFTLANSLLSNGNPTYSKVIGVLSLVEPITFMSEYLRTKKVNDTLFYKMKYNRSRKPKPLNYKGKMYVLTNGNSFSASSLISTHLKANNRAVFVGEETGGAYNGCVAGFYRILKLPNSKLHIRMGLMQLETTHKQTPDGFGVVPDVEVVPTVKDRQSDRDTELEWILNDIYKDE